MNHLKLAKYTKEELIFCNGLEVKAKTQYSPKEYSGILDIKSIMHIESDICAVGGILSWTYEVTAIPYYDGIKNTKIGRLCIIV